MSKINPPWKLERNMMDKDIICDDIDDLAQLNMIPPLIRVRQDLCQQYAHSCLLHGAIHHRSTWSKASIE